MPKYLRYLSSWFVAGSGPATDFHPVGKDVVIPAADVSYLCWMYQYHALPIPVDGVSKMNVFLTIGAGDSPAVIDPLDIGSVWEGFSLSEYERLDPADRPRAFTWTDCIEPCCAARSSSIGTPILFIVPSRRFSMTT